MWLQSKEPLFHLSSCKLRPHFNQVEWQKKLQRIAPKCFRKFPWTEFSKYDAKLYHILLLVPGDKYPYSLRSYTFLCIHVIFLTKRNHKWWQDLQLTYKIWWVYMAFLCISIFHCTCLRNVKRTVIASPLYALLMETVRHDPAE